MFTPVKSVVTGAIPPPAVDIGDHIESAELEPKPTYAIAFVDDMSVFGNAAVDAYIPINDRCVATAADDDIPKRIEKKKPPRNAAFPRQYCCAPWRHPATEPAVVADTYPIRIVLASSDVDAIARAVCVPVAVFCNRNSVTVVVPLPVA
jgi:hypothetical protein